MKTIRAFLAVLALAAGPAVHAQLFRAYLSITGNDNAACTLAAPCRLLPAALTAVANGGEIWMLDSANYNTSTVSIAKSVTVLAVPGAVGSVVAAGGPAILISAPSLSVTLRNLVVVPLPGGNGTNGIEVTGAGATLVVEGSTISNHADYGILVNAPGRTRIKGSTIRDSGNTGVQIQGLNPLTTTLVDISESAIEGNSGDGLAAVSGNATATIRATVHNSRVTQNALSGVVAQSNVGGVVAVAVNGSLVSNNGSAGLASTGTAAAVITAAGNVVVGNGSGLTKTPSASFETAGNNIVRGNTNVNSSGITTLTPN